MNFLNSILSPLSIPAYFAVILLLFSRKLWKNYLFFWLYLCLEGVAVLATTLFQADPKIPLYIYLAAQPPVWVLYVLMVVELYRKVFVQFPGIARYGQRVIIVSFLTALLIALISIGGDLGSGWTTSSLFVRSSAVTRTISSAVTLFFVFIAVFLLWMPVPLPLNTIRHSFVSFFYFLLVTSVHFILNRTRNPSAVPLANLALHLITIGSLAAWAILLRPEGEAIPAYSRPPNEKTSAILQRLEALNRSLSSPKDY